MGAGVYWQESETLFNPMSQLLFHFILYALFPPLLHTHNLKLISGQIYELFVILRSAAFLQRC